MLGDPVDARRPVRRGRALPGPGGRGSLVSWVVREGPHLITSVQRAFRLLEAVSEHQNGAPAKQLARETGLPLATATCLLRTPGARRIRAGKRWTTAASSSVTS